MDESYGMRVHFAAGQISAGSLHLAMGKVPDSYFRTVDAGTAIYRNVYWRMYVRNQTGWSGGGGYKLSRAISFATSTWRSEEHTSELQSHSDLVCRLLLEKK